MRRGNALCRLCGLGEESGTHLTFDCVAMLKKWGWRWGEWGVLNDHGRWKYEYEENGKVRVRYWAEDNYNELGEVLSGVG